MRTKNKAKLNIPYKKEDLHITKEYGDCSGYYYLPVIGWFYVKRVKMICELMRASGKKVLDIGYGSGLLFHELNNRFCFLSGMDIRKDAKSVKDKLQKSGIRTNLINGNLFHIPYMDASFDCIVAMSVLEHISDLEQPVREMRRVLKDDGELICGFPTKNIMMHQFFKLIGFNDDKDHPSSHNYVYKVLKENFKIEKTIRLPSFLPMDHCLYVACICRK